MRLRVVVAVAALDALAALLFTSTYALAGTVVTLPAPVTRAALTLTTYAHLCDLNDNHVLCLRDPSDGGTGTTVLGSLNGTSDSFDFAPVADTGRCGGTVTETCPFTNTTLDTMYEGKSIVNILQEVSQACVRFDHTTGIAVMGTCDTGSEPSAAWVFDVLCQGACNAYVNVNEANKYGTPYQMAANISGVDNSLITSVQNNPPTLYETWACLGGVC